MSHHFSSGFGRCTIITRFSRGLISSSRRPQYVILSRTCLRSRRSWHSSINKSMYYCLDVCPIPKEKGDDTFAVNMYCRATAPLLRRNAENCGELDYGLGGKASFNITMGTICWKRHGTLAETIEYSFSSNNRLLEKMVTIDFDYHFTQF